MLFNKISVAAGVLFLALFSGNAIAQSDFYVLGAFGTTNSDVALGGMNYVDDNDSSFALGAGYAFSANFSVEAAYQDFGVQDGETDCPPDFFCLTIPLTTQADISGISLSLVGSVPLTDKLDAYGKIGFASWDIEFDGISAAFDDSGEDVLYGAGLRLSIDDHWKAFLEYQKLDLDLDTANVGLNYRF